MSMILDVCSALLPLLEPVPDPPAEDLIVERIALDTEPLIWEPNRLYVYPIRVAEIPFETAASRRQEFDLNAVVVVDNEGEEARSERSETLAQWLDNRRGQYLAAVRANQAGPPWSMLRGLVDTTSPRMLDKRSAAVRISGWRIIGG